MSPSCSSPPSRCPAYNGAQGELAHAVALHLRKVGWAEKLGCGDRDLRAAVAALREAVIPFLPLDATRPRPIRASPSPPPRSRSPAQPGAGDRGLDDGV